MEVRKDSQNGTPVASPTDTIGAFQVQTQDCIDNWAQQLGDDPDRFADIEQQIDQHYRQGAGQLVASLLAEVTSDPQMDEHVEKIRQNAAIPLRAPQPRTIKLRLLCGLLVWVTTAYCAPRRGKACRLYTSGLNARSEFKPRNREVCHSSDSNPNGLRPWWQFFGSIIVAAESCQQGHEFR